MKTLAAATILLAGITSTLAQCSASQDTLCCTEITPYPQNGGVCGLIELSNKPTIGQNCVPKVDATCPDNHVESCCAGTFTSNSAGCNAGIQCSVAPGTAPIPEGWSVAQSCAVDFASRIFSYPEVYQLPNNTPETCIRHCQTNGYSYAGVEYGNECICGTGYAPGADIQAVDPSECNMPCSGNAGLTCGAGWRIQVYVDDYAPTDTSYPGWEVYSACSIDDEDRIIEQGTTYDIFTDNTPGKCMEHCDELGYDIAGVEHGQECFCGHRLRDGNHHTDPSECNQPCTGNDSVTCGAGWRIQLYKRSYCGQQQR